jgi:cytosine/adenosine deaminase-related metal-dependent hydrolase
MVPPLVNGHTHAAMALFRGCGDDLPLTRWLRERIWPVEAKLLPENVYWGTRLACLGIVRSGTVRFWDMYWDPEAVARAVRDAGLRATVAAPLIDAGRTMSALRADRALAGRAFAVTGPEVLTQLEQVHAIGAAIGRELRVEEQPADVARRKYEAVMGAEYANGVLAYWASLVDAPERATGDVESVTGRPARTVAQWARDHADDFVA